MGPQRLRRPALAVLIQWPFLLALLVLLANDFYLKQHFANALTGKLSDFAGLFVFAQFLAAVTGAQIRRVCWITAGMFVFWKSPAASPFIAYFNSQFPLRIARVIDYGDLFALGILPVAAKMYSYRSAWQPNAIKIPVTILTVFAITATSTIPTRYHVSLILQSPQGHYAGAEVIYQKVEAMLYPLGFKCDDCELSTSYRRYVGARGELGPLRLKFNYDETSGNLFIALETFEPTPAHQAYLDDLSEKISKTLDGEGFTRTKIVRSLYFFESDAIKPTHWTLSMSLPSANILPMCAGKGYDDAEVRKAFVVLHKFLADTGAIYALDGACQNNQDRCTPAMCLHNYFGQVTGPNRWSRFFELNTQGYTGWGGTTLYIRLTDRSPTGAGEPLMRELEAQMRTALNPSVIVSLQQEK